MSDVETAAGKIPKVISELSFQDQLGALKTRLNINRMNYRVNPGLYALGNPKAASPVFVSANFKLSFDILRKELNNTDGWILVLDTKGINVWCAAGKGTFGTDELIKKIKETDLDKIVDHRKLIVPQLGATGVAAHKVKAATAFKVIYGPVRASDLPIFTKQGYKALPNMRKVVFPFIDRLKLIPVELTGAIKYFIVMAALFFLFAGLNSKGYSSHLALENGSRAFLFLLSAFISGAVIVPAMLPFIPGRTFSFKGFLTGILLLNISFLFFSFPGILELIAWHLIIPSISAFLAMNFTGASTFTSLSGVKKEMKTALPLQIAGFSAGTVMWIISRFVS